LYDHLRFVPRYRCIVMCYSLANRDEFPTLDAWGFNPQSLGRRVWRRFAGTLLYPSDLRLRLLAPRILHTHFGYVAAEDLTMQRSLRVPWIVSFYGADVYQLGQRPDWQEKYASVFRQATRVLALGPVMAARLERLGCPAEKIIIHPLGVDCGELPSKPRVLRPGEPLRILFAGTLREKKGAAYLIDGVAFARQAGLPLELHLVGDAGNKPGDQETKEAIWAAISRLDLQSVVTHHPYIRYRELIALALQSHVFAVPSITARDGDSEGTPFVLQQMMATGMPVIATEHSDIPFIFGEHRHMLVPERDARGIADRLIRYAKDPGTLVTDGTALSNQIRSHFDVRDWAPRLSEIYDAVRPRSAGSSRVRVRATNIKNKPLLPDVGVIALVPDHWNDLWQPRHQVLCRLANYFHVVWVDPPQEWREAITPWRSSTRAKSQASNGFIVYIPPLWLPNLYRPQWLARLSLRQRLKRARSALLARGCKRIILYLWRPDFAPALNCVPFDVSCYHIDDEYSFSTDDQPIDNIEKKLIGEVHQVFIHSPGLLEKKGNINRNTAYVPNGADYQAFASPLPEPTDLAAIPHPRIGYTGFLKRMLDWPLVMTLSAEHPEWSFVFVGPAHAHPEVTEAMGKLSGRRNVHFLGSKLTPELASYPQHFDVCIMPYRSDDYTKYINPLKLHEYLASGRPVVGTRIRSLQEFSDVVSLVDTPHDWSAAISDALSPTASTAERRAARQAVAQRYDWRRLVAQIAYFMAERLGREYAQRFSELAGPEFTPPPQ
jgi:colanic acid/amylovoran biosynthesis glycosyltransferase